MSSLYPAARMAVLALLAVSPGVAAAQDVQAGDLVIQHPWARATPNGAQVAGGYLTILNRGREADTLTGGSLDAADKAEVHDMAMENGVMRMRPTGPLTIPPGATVTLSPAGRHIMFTGLKRALKKGDTVAGSLRFARAGTVPVRFEVEGIGAKAPSGHGAGAMPGMTIE